MVIWQVIYALLMFCLAIFIPAFLASSLALYFYRKEVKRIQKIDELIKAGVL